MSRAAGEWIAAVALLATAACGSVGGGHGDSNRIPSAAELVGSYDVTLSYSEGLPDADTVGTVSVGSDGLLVISIAGAAVRGPLADDGSLTLSGMQTGTDAPLLATGDAQVGERDGIRHVEGTVVAGDLITTGFVMRRPVDADARPASARYRLGFEESPSSCRCVSTVELELTFSREGTGTHLDDVDERAAEGMALSTISHVFVDLAPSGLFDLEAAYLGHTEGVCATTAGGGPCRLLIGGDLPNPGTTVTRYTLVTGLGYWLSSGTVTIERIETQQ